MAFDPPGILSCLVGIIGGVGIVAAIVARVRVDGEAKILEHGSSRLIATPQVSGPEKASRIDFLKSEGLPEDSHFADCLMSVWSGWVAGRLPTLTELHSLAARRERRRLSARLARGITGLLIVGGIAGTLISIPPILDRFRIDSDVDGKVDSSQRVKSGVEVVHGLGRAFRPSLSALLLTVCVAAANGVYLHAASKLAWNLDRFAVNVLFPIFRPRTFGEELVEVQNRLSKLITCLEGRDKEFGNFLKAFSDNAEELKLAAPSLTKVAASVSKAAASLTGDAKALQSALETHLGTESPIVKKLESIKFVADANQEAAEQLRVASLTLVTASETTTKIVVQARDQLQTAVSTIPGKIEESCAVGSKELRETSRSAAKEVAEVVSRTGKATAAELNQAIAAVPEISQVLIEACHTSTLEAAAKLADAAAQASASLQSQVEPIRTVANEIDGANEALQNEVREVLSAHLAVLNGFRHTAECKPWNAGLKPLWQRICDLFRI